MYFYQDYLAFLKLTCEKSSPNPHLKSLLSTLQFPQREIYPHEIERILVDLDLLETHFNSDKQIYLALINLQDHLIKEIKTIVQSHQGVIPELVVRKWFEVNPQLCRLIVSSLAGVLNTYQTLVKILETTAVKTTKTNKTLDLLYLVLRRSVLLTTPPPNAWYESIAQLQAYSSRDKLIQLGLTDLAAFQQLELDYPGFLATKVTSFDDLDMFCQLLPNNFYYLLHAPQVQQYVPDAAHFVTILLHIKGISVFDRNRLILEKLKNLDDLVAVTQAYPDLINLIAKPTDSGISYKEGMAAQWIVSRDDLLRFNLSSPSMQTIIQNVPRFREMIGTNEAFIFSSMKNLLRPKRKENSSKNAEIDDRFLSLGQTISLMQFHEDAGYYTNGTISFANDSKEGHFSTEASDGYYLAIALAYRAFAIWQQLEGSHKTHFDILECGAGDGDLCYKILEFIDAMAKLDVSWLEFAAAVHYTIIEISPALVKRQERLLSDLIAQNKVEVIQDDALQMKFYNKKAALHISNELMDMFPSEQIILDEQNQVQVAMLMPILTPAAYIYLKQHHPEYVLGLEAESYSLSKLVQAEQITLDHEGFPITAERFKVLMRITTDPNFSGPLDSFFFSRFIYPVHLFPEIEKYLAEHDEVLLGMQAGDNKIISPGLAVYARLIAEKSLVSIVVDYGATTVKLKNFGYRSYGDDSEMYQYLPLTHPGKRDITYDVDFTALITSLNQQAAKGSVTLVEMNQLLPRDFKIPAHYRSSIKKSDLENFNDPQFLSAVYIAKDTSISLQDLESQAKKLVTRHQFFKQVEQQAQQTIEMNQRMGIQSN
ncbi:MAG: SAM-dependent methyltransferase [Legionella sp.]|jgi:SAM-dependent MidA family methyltransferase